MQKYDWLSEEENLRQMYCAEKMSIDSIARHYGCAYKTVSAAMKKHGIETRRSGDSSRCNANTMLIRIILIPLIQRLRHTCLA